MCMLMQTCNLLSWKIHQHLPTHQIQDPNSTAVYNSIKASALHLGLLEFHDDIFFPSTVIKRLTACRMFRFSVLRNKTESNTRGTWVFPYEPNMKENGLVDVYEENTRSAYERDTPFYVTFQPLWDIGKKMSQVWTLSSGVLRVSQLI